MKKVLLIGEEARREAIRDELLKSSAFELELSDGDDQEDFKDYDIIFDLNFDDDPENYHIYTGLTGKIVFLSSVKKSLAETNFIEPHKVRCHLFGLNCIPQFIKNTYWEVSLFRGHELEILEDFFKTAKLQHLLVDERVGMYRPLTRFVYLNELAKSVESGLIHNYSDNIHLLKELEEIDEYGVTEVFEVLISVYEDTQDMKYYPCSLLKKKYLRNHSFLKK